MVSGEFTIEGLLAILSGQIEAMGAQRLVIDAVDGLLRLFRDHLHQQNQLYLLHNWLRQQQLTTMLTAKRADGSNNPYHTLDYLVDCILCFDQRVVNQVVTRRLRVLKYRGSGFLSNEYPYVITASGVELVPISSTQLRQQPLGPPFSTGNPRLDSLLRGGFRRAASILVAGSSGTGKTTLACSFAVAACQRGERVLYVSFEESQAALVNTMLSPGVDLRPALAAEQLRILTTMPEALGVEDHLMRILQAIDEFQPDHLVVEAISACWRMGSEHAAFDFLVRLIDTCKARGITSVYTNQIRNGGSGYSPDVEEISGIGISSLTDTLLLLEQRWWQQEYTRRLLIIKARGSQHSHYFHSFTISAQGIFIDETPVGTIPDRAKEAMP